MAVNSSEDGAGPASVWSEAFSVGIPEIDSDHRILFDLAGQIVEAANGEEAAVVTGGVLLALSDYADYHFEREERVMRAVGYPGEADHTIGHEKLRATVNQMAARYQADPNAVAASELAAFLLNWLTNHILDEDMQYRPYAERNKAAGAAAAASIGSEFFTDEDADDLLVFQEAGRPE